MRSTCCILLTVALTATSSHGGFDAGHTHDGAHHASGRMRQMDDALGQMLVQTNNDLATAEVITPPTAPGGDQLSPAQRDSFALGHVLDGPRGVKFTYDRLVAQRVLQVLEYTLEPLYTHAPKVDGPPSVDSLRSGVSADRNSDSVSRGSQVPEPSAAAALMFGLMLLMSRRLGRSSNPDAA